MEQCAGGPANGLGIFSGSANVWSGAVKSFNLNNATDGSCTMVWRCDANCKFDSTASSATLHVRSVPRSWANYVAYSLQLPAFTPDASTDSSAAGAPFIVESSFYAPGTSLQNMSALRGSAATKIKIVMSPYIKATTQSAATDVAFLPSLLGVQFGPVMTPDTFAFNDSASFAIDFELARNSLSLVKCAALLFLALRVRCLGLSQSSSSCLFPLTAQHAIKQVDH
jgi:hypothetical protein